jgi:hypothetical protein
VLRFPEPSTSKEEKSMEEEKIGIALWKTCANPVDKVVDNF